MNIFSSWKTTAQSILTVAITISGVFSSIGITGGKVGTTGTVMLAVSSVAKILLGVLQTDAAPATPTVPTT